MKKYKTVLHERRLPEWKGWYNPDSGFLRQFNSNLIHSEIAEEEFKCNEIEAMKKGYYRIFAGHEINIDSWEVPTDREFNATRFMLEENVFKKFNATRWVAYHKSKRGFWFFPNLSFLFAEKITDGIYKNF